MLVFNELLSKVFPHLFGPHAGVDQVAQAGAQCRGERPRAGRSPEDARKLRARIEQAVDNGIVEDRIGDEPVLGPAGLRSEQLGEAVESMEVHTEESESRLDGADALQPVGHPPRRRDDSDGSRLRFAAREAGDQGALEVVERPVDAAQHDFHAYDTNTIVV